MAEGSEKGVSSALSKVGMTAFGTNLERGLQLLNRRCVEHYVHGQKVSRRYGLEERTSIY